MEPSIKSENCESNKRKRKPDLAGRERDLRRWQRRRATIDKYKGEKFNVPETDRGVGLSLHNLRQ
jgi:hypothetical protein